MGRGKDASRLEGPAERGGDCGAVRDGLASVRTGNRAGISRAMQQMAGLMEEAPVNGAPVRSNPSAPARPGVSPINRGPVAVAPPGTRPIAPQAPSAPQAPNSAMGMPMGGTGGDPWVAQVMAQQLEAVLLFAEGRREEALVLARQAAVVEATLPFELSPPVPVKPVNEQVGEMLMDLRRPKEAIEAFELSLKRTPRRTLSLLGLARAAMARRTSPPRSALTGNCGTSGRRRTRHCPS